MRKIWIGILLSLLIIGISTAPAFAASFGGNWACDKGVWVFNLHLEESDGIITGRHVAISDYGRRLDGVGTESPTLDGSVNGNTAIINWHSTYSRAEGQAKITIVNENTIHWQITAVTIADSFYLPREAYLKRVTSFDNQPPTPIGEADIYLKDRPMQNTRFSFTTPISQVITVLGNPTKIDYFNSNGALRGYTYYWPDITITAETTGRLLIVTVTDYNTMTARGIGSGSSPSVVERLYGPPQQKQMVDGNEAWFYSLPNRALLIFAFNEQQRLQFYRYWAL
ncbi:MAG: hypothetical protein P4N59_12260 [Negativicutes bacterium]|nr:hypothetical protein [Negativicutes bacterium]